MSRSLYEVSIPQIPADPITGLELREALLSANLPALAAMLVQMTGDEKWLGDRYQPTRTRGMEDNDSGGLPEAVQDEIRDAAFEAITAWQNGAPVAIPRPSDEMLVRILSVSMGETVAPEYGPMLAADFGFERDAIDEALASTTPPADFRAIVIGSGVSGIAAGVNLDKLGVPYTILEKSTSVGGTWRDNHYPGAGVDTPNHLYSFSFAENDWRMYYALQDELRSYLERVASQFDVLSHVQFGSEVLSATYEPEHQSWRVSVRDCSGAVRDERASIVISAVGAFGKPKYPDIPGAESFTGVTVHTAQWDDDLDLTGKRVVVIGNGASAMQLVPAIAEQVEHLTVFQRSPQWAAPFEKHKKQVPAGVRRLLIEVPLYGAWYRARLNWTFNDKVHPSLQKDPTWEHPDRSVNAVNDAHRRHFARYLEAQLADRKDLVEKVLPSYPPFGKRMLLDNGWYSALTRDNVELVTDRVDSITATGVSAGDRPYDADVIVYATGFDVVNFLAPLEIRGRSGRTLHDTWDGDNARAYLGLAVPDFPNFFILYGPNAQAGHGGSLIRIVEIQIHYLMGLLESMFTENVGAIECRNDVFEVYNKRVDEAHDSMVWTHQGMDVYYRNARGRVVVNNPFRIVDFWKMARTPNVDEFLTEPRTK